MHAHPSSYVLVAEKATREQNLTSDCYYWITRPVFYSAVDVELFSFATLSVFFMRYSGRTSSLLPAKDECGFYNNRDSY